MAAQLLSQSPEVKKCIQECWNCHSICLQTIDYCLQKGGNHVTGTHLKILANCAEICQTSFNIMLTGSPFHTRSCDLCAEICEQCATSCEKFSDDAQMKLCADACRSCARSCTEMSGQMEAA